MGVFFFAKGKGEKTHLLGLKKKNGVVIQVKADKRALSVENYGLVTFGEEEKSAYVTSQEYTGSIPTHTVFCILVLFIFFYIYSLFPPVSMFPFTYSLWPSSGYFEVNIRQ